MDFDKLSKKSIFENPKFGMFIKIHPKGEPFFKNKTQNKNVS